jgi:hypothetical protein
MNKRAVGVICAALVFAAGVMTAVALADPGNGQGVNNGDTDPTASCQPSYGGDPCIHNGNSAPGTAKGHGNCEDDRGKGNNGNDNGNDRLPCAATTAQTTTTVPTTVHTTTTVPTTSAVHTTTTVPGATTAPGATTTTVATTTTTAVAGAATTSVATTTTPAATTTAPLVPPAAKPKPSTTQVSGASTPPASPKTSGVLAAHSPSPTQLAFTP